MKERTYKLTVGSIALTATYFSDGLGECRREPLSEIFDDLSGIHRHAECEIFFVWSGEMELVTERENLRFRDSVVAVPQGLGHYTAIDAERIFVIYISVDGDGEVGKRLAEMLSRGVFSIEISSDEKFYLEKLTETRNRSDQPHLLSLLFSELFSRILPDIFATEKEGEASGKYAFALDEYVERHYCEKICLCDVAAYLHLCEKQVSRVIKKEFGCSFPEYVNRKRLAVAAMMLKHTEMTVTEIARRVGFENDNYFYRVFKKKYSMTPNEYKKTEPN